MAEVEDHIVLIRLPAKEERTGKTCESGISWVYDNESNVISSITTYAYGLGANCNVIFEATNVVALNPWFIKGDGSRTFNVQVLSRKMEPGGRKHDRTDELQANIRIKARTVIED